MQRDVWLAFIGASIAISVSPGAGAIQSMATGLSYGLRRGYWSIAGLQIGLMMQLAAVSEDQFIGKPFEHWFWRRQTLP